MIFTVVYAALASLTNKGLCKANCHLAVNSIRRVAAPCCGRPVAAINSGRGSLSLESSLSDQSVNSEIPSSKFEKHMSALDSILGSTNDEESTKAEYQEHPFMSNYNQATQDKMNRIAQRCKMLAEKIVSAQKFPQISKKLDAHRELQLQSGGFLTAEIFYSALELLKATNRVIEDVKDYKIQASLESFKDDVHSEIKRLQKSVAHFVIKNKEGRKMVIHYDSEY